MIWGDLSLAKMAVPRKGEFAAESGGSEMHSFGIAALGRFHLGQENSHIVQMPTPLSLHKTHSAVTDEIKILGHNTFQAK